jgi:AraC family transcriptional regulator of adaptative response / DNA-3-methyladenine glycosylase II
LVAVSDLLIPYRPPFDWTSALAFFRYRAIAGVEEVTSDVYRRYVRANGSAGKLEITHDPERDCLLARVTDDGLAEAALQRVPLMFGLDTSLDEPRGFLSPDPYLGSLIELRPSVRVPGNWDSFELAMRAVLGQQVSVTAAVGLLGRLVLRCSSTPFFPSAEEVLTANLSNFGMPASRVATLKHVAEAALANPHLFDRGDSLDETISRLRDIKGIGDWTAHYIAMRACRQMDAFPASDVGLLRGTASDGVRLTPAELLAKAEAWRPWRAFAAQHVWVKDAG